MNYPPSGSTFRLHTIALDLICKVEYHRVDSLPSPRLQPGHSSKIHSWYTRQSPLHRPTNPDYHVSEDFPISPWWLRCSLVSFRSYHCLTVTVSHTHSLFSSRYKVETAVIIDDIILYQSCRTILNMPSIL